MTTADERTQALERAQALFAANTLPASRSSNSLLISSDVTVLGERSRERYRVVSEGYRTFVYVTNLRCEHHSDYGALRLCIGFETTDYPPQDLQLALALHVQHDELNLLYTSGWYDRCICRACISFRRTFGERFERGFVHRSPLGLYVYRARHLVRNIRSSFTTGELWIIAAIVTTAVASVWLSIFGLWAWLA